jgi:integrase
VFFLPGSPEVAQLKKDSHFKFTKEALERIKPPVEGRVIYHDTKQPGLKLRVGTTGVKTFLVYKKVSGKPVKTTLGRFPDMTIDQAQKLAAASVAQMLDGIDPNKAKRANRVRGVELQQCLSDYLEVRGRNLADSTRTNYRAMIEKHLGDWSTKPLRDIGRDMIAKRHQRIAMNSPIAANNVMRVLRALYNFANGQYEGENGESLFPDNPVKRLSHTRSWVPERRRQTIIKVSDLPRWFDALDVLREPTDENLTTSAATIADYLEFVLFTGLRRDDALSLRWDQVDLSAKTMSPVIHKKSRSVMSFPLSAHVVELLKRRHRTKVNDYVFHGRLDGREDVGRLDEPKRQIARIVAMTGIKFSSHDVRRTFITAAESLDLSPFALKRLCSHSTGNDVTAGYVIMDVERLRAPTEKIAEYLLKAAGRLPAAEIIEIKKTRKKE